MSLLHTPLCDLLGIEHPVLSAGMGGVAGPTLAAAVSNAGGLGVIGATSMNPDALREAIRKTREMTDKPFGVDLLLPADRVRREAGPDDHVTTRRTRRPAGEAPAVTIPEVHREFVEGLAREWDLPEVTVSAGRPRGSDRWSVADQVKVVLEERVPVFASGLGDPAFMADAAHERGIVVLGLVGNVRNARGVAAGPTDIIVAQGHEAGGHTGRIGSLALIPQVVDAVAPKPVIAAGGIADGRGLAAALCLGAVGVWCGTAFLASREGMADIADGRPDAAWRAQVVKDKIVAATEEDTVVSRVLTGKPARLLRTPLTEAWERPDSPGTLPMPLQGALVNPLQRRVNAARRQDLATEAAGQISGMITRIPPAAELVEEMVRGAIETLRGRTPSG